MWHKARFARPSGWFPDSGRCQTLACRRSCRTGRRKPWPGFAMVMRAADRDRHRPFPVSEDMSDAGADGRACRIGRYPPSGPDGHRRRDFRDNRTQCVFIERSSAVKRMGSGHGGGSGSDATYWQARQPSRSCDCDVAGNPADMAVWCGVGRQYGLTGRRVRHRWMRNHRQRPLQALVRHLPARIVTA